VFDLILVVNFGSSSFKFKIFESSIVGRRYFGFVKNFSDKRGKSIPSALVWGVCEKIGKDSGKVIYNTKEFKVERKILFKNHKSAFFTVKNMLYEPGIGIIKSFDEITAIGHRIVHGGTFFKNAAEIDKSVIEKIKSLIPLAPIHNAANLEGIKDCHAAFGGVPQFAVFDTSFFADLPPESFTFAIPGDLAEKHKIRKYGFHGISHEWAYLRYKSIQTDKKKESKESKVITCHLGNGSSVAAIINGRPIETSMGLTPLGGLVMGTRCGSIDPSVVTFLLKNENLNADQIENILNKKSGLLGITGFSDDIRNVIKSSHEKCRLAVNIFCRKVTQFIGGYAALMNGCDAIVFTGGIGENQPVIREKILENLKFLGVYLDAELNNLTISGKENLISLKNSKIDIFVARADEERSIAISVASFFDIRVEEADFN
jgi:acetate kinase